MEALRQIDGDIAIARVIYLKPFIAHAEPDEVHNRLLIVHHQRSQGMPLTRRLLRALSACMWFLLIHAYAPCFHVPTPTSSDWR
jgi:hypothetical protein